LVLPDSFLGLMAVVSNNVEHICNFYPIFAIFQLSGTKQRFKMKTFFRDLLYFHPEMEQSDQFLANVSLFFPLPEFSKY